MSAPVPDLPDSEVVFSRDRTTRRPLLQRGITVMVFAGLAAAASARLGPPMLVVAGLLGLSAVWCGSSYALESTFRTVLRPDGIHIRRYRTRIVPWTDVAGFRVRGQGDPVGKALSAADGQQAPRLELGLRGPVWDRDNDRHRQPSWRRVTVAVVRTGGGQLTLPAPVVTGERGDYQFDDKVRQLEQWRVHYGQPPLRTWVPAEGQIF